MSKVSEEEKKRYSDKIKHYKKEIEDLKKREKHLEQIIANDDVGGVYKKITIANENLSMIAYYVLMNRISLSLLAMKNENFLNDARKLCYRVLIKLEEIVSNYVDVPFSDYEEKLEAIVDLDDAERYLLLKKLGFSINSVESSFGDNSKWKWSFVELEGRFATVAKNMLNLKTVYAGMDPRVEGYEARVSHVNLVKSQLQSAADRYRQKYELSTSRIDDFKQAIAYLSALKRIHVLLNERNKAEEVKRKLEVWSNKMESDEKRQEQAAKKKRMEKK
ncbi:MAG: hypothetical protein ACLFR1_00315 [Spirochaetia bacterium]